MNVTCVRAGTGYVVLNAQHDIVGIIKSFEDSWKIDKPKPLRTDPSKRGKVGD